MVKQVALIHAGMLLLALCLQLGAAAAGMEGATHLIPVHQLYLFIPFFFNQARQVTVPRMEVAAAGHHQPLPDPGCSRPGGLAAQGNGSDVVAEGETPSTDLSEDDPGSLSGALLQSPVLEEMLLSPTAAY
ncbi:BTB/POZ domain-containing protein 17-like protein [Lates japonicus]|uniref:BTB/POZ domain-containing protein 17-like protein n=1 Tax=Lates japonicus TaxID=270547 RepID=A0AAD3N164_LATJO|nr:BTB/POZ domain-containing protein 17-like protein [Lates japonicus]